MRTIKLHASIVGLATAASSVAAQHIAASGHQLWHDLAGAAVTFAVSSGLYHRWQIGDLQRASNVLEARQYVRESHRVMLDNLQTIVLKCSHPEVLRAVSRIQLEMMRTSGKLQELTPEEEIDEPRC